jgi:ArsR family transcriptional regulator
MALSKQPFYSIKDQLTANFGRALSHSARVKIIKQLAEKGESCVQVIAEGHPISKATLSNHLKILREAQLVNWHEQYPYTFYSLNAKAIAKARLDLDHYFDTVDAR